MSRNFKNRILDIRILNIRILGITGLLFILFTTSCTVSKIYPRRYYEEHQDLLHATETLYGQATRTKSLAIAFTDLDFENLSLELKTDTVRYIYDFNWQEPRMRDSLQRYGYDTSLVGQIICNMRSMKSTWINAMDHYVDRKKQSLVILSAPVKQFSIFPPMQKRKYYLFGFYRQPQYYDEQGRLLDKKTLRRLRKINSEVFYRINDKVCYTISGKFR